LAQRWGGGTGAQTFGGGVLEETGIQLERKLISAVSAIALAGNSIGA
jgi:hypothetical protein